MKGIIVLGIFALGMVGLIIGMSVNTAVDPVPMAPMGFEVGNSENHYQEMVCPCKNDWALATNERLLSNSMFSQTNHMPDPRSLSSMTGFWGQFMDHDIVSSESDPTQGYFEIPMVPSDAILNMTRNTYRSVGTCREAKTLNTPNIDASTIYGDYFRPTLIDTLRDAGNCKLRTSAGNLMPLNQDNTFMSGDDRNTEHSLLASLHTLFMREHNRLCDDMPADWTEDAKFWKARQVVIAKMQRITYEEYLPALLGSQTHLLHSVLARGTDTRIAMEFSVLAYRFGHSQIPDPIGSFSLPSLFFNAQLLIDNGIDAFLGAGYTTPAETVDAKVVDGLRNFLFSAGPSIIGEDLIARNLFRQRELGMGTYTQLTECYGVPHGQKVTEDAYIGLLCEDLVPGSSLPRTIANIVAEQFKRLRDNDAQFYTKIGAELGSKYYREVRGSTLGSIIEANTGLENVPKNVFFV